MAGSDHKDGGDGNSGQHNRVKVSPRLVAKMKKRASYSAPAPTPSPRPAELDSEDQTLEDALPPVASSSTPDSHDSHDEGLQSEGLQSEDFLTLADDSVDSSDATLEFEPDATGKIPTVSEDAPTIDQVEESLPPPPTLPQPSRASNATEAAPKKVLTLNERLRGLSPAEQQKRARYGELSERKILERYYGRNVWESLLKNPRISPPEVARISRMGALPLPLLETIVGNRSWLSSPQVRRALLSNRRLSKDMVMTVLRATPKSELKLMVKQMAYPAPVREAAAKLCR